MDYRELAHAIQRGIDHYAEQIESCRTSIRESIAAGNTNVDAYRDDIRLFQAKIDALVSLANDFLPFKVRMEEITWKS